MASESWVGSDGPLVLISEANLAGWLGCYVAADDPDEADMELPNGQPVVVGSDGSDQFAKACEAVGEIEQTAYAAPLKLDGGEALVLGSSGEQATFVSMEGGARIGIWVHAEDEESAANAVTQAGNDLKWNRECLWSCGGPGLLQDAAQPGGDDSEEEPIGFDLPAGRYVVESTDFSPDDETRVIVLRLLPA